MHVRYRKRAFSVLFILMLTIWPICPAYAAESDSCRAVIGADLTEEQIHNVYTLFGISRGDVPELRLTNVEEREAMKGFVDEAVLGTKTISCVYLELLPQGSGFDVRLENISWCTPEMYINALETVGVQDARLVVAAPVTVSGTGAIAGIYKAYEDMTDTGIDEQAKEAGTQELTVTGELAEDIGVNDSATIVSELKEMLNETANMTDDDIRETVRTIAERHKVRLTDAQVEQLLDLCRTLEKLDPDTLKKRVENVQETFQRVEETKDQVVGFFESIKQLISTLESFMEKLNGFFGGRT